MPRTPHRVSRRGWAGVEVPTTPAEGMSPSTIYYSPTTTEAPPGEAPAKVKTPSDGPAPAVHSEAEGHVIPTEVKQPAAESTEIQVLLPAESPGPPTTINVPITAEAPPREAPAAPEVNRPATLTEGEAPPG